jgi:lipopolysaccharide heptosyltransferase II
MVIERAKVKRILVITLSNVGDVILTTPVIATLVKEFPGARIDVMVGPRGKEVFEKDPRVFKLIIYDKHLPISGKRRLQLKLKKLQYDLVVDLKNTIFPLLIAPKYRTAAIQNFPAHIVHSMDKHLYRLHALGITEPVRQSYLHITQEDVAFIDRLLKDEGIKEPFVLMNPGAKSHLKRWTPEAFAAVADSLIGECKVDVAFIGLEEDSQIVAGVIQKMKNKCHDIVGKTNLRQLAQLLKRSKLLITNDSAPLHLGCAVGTKVLALFGPTDPKKYGPTGEFDAVMNRKLHCSPCETAKCAYNYECMTSIDPDEVFDTARMMIEGYE